jgi:hypothetical protein
LASALKHWTQKINYEIELHYFINIFVCTCRFWAIAGIGDRSGGEGDAAAYHVPGLSAVVVHGDRVILCKGYGESNTDLHTPLTASARPI